MKTDEELKELAKRTIKNEIFVAANKESIENAFMMILALGAEFPDDTVALYEEYSKAGPRSLNGYPMFMSCGALSKDEFEIFVKYYKQYEELLA